VRRARENKRAVLPRLYYAILTWRFSV
jgi:hypothetical protein